MLNIILEKLGSLVTITLLMCLSKHTNFFLQVEAIKKIADYVSQLRRVGKGHGMYITTIIFHIGPQTLPYITYIYAYLLV